MRPRNHDEAVPAAEPAQTTVIEASPTKDFFISMLVKDIELIPAISDLVDNSVDGAKRQTQDRFDGYWVRIDLDAQQFKIADNCGGMSVEIARKYAFRFGRPDDMIPTPHSVGQFGVGMKRALFKLGREFVIESATDTSRFKVDVDVETWRHEEEWQFAFAELDEDVETPEDGRGTTILVTSLHDGVSQDFALETFVGRLREELERRHQRTMDNGLAINVNGVPLRVNVVDLLHSEELKPAFEELSFNGAADQVTAKIWAGISASSPRDAGWYIFCNGRLVLGPDQTEVTGWGEGGGDVIPKYHNQFARFRGYVFFDSDDSSRLPWNTTKTTVDLDSDVFRRTRQKMLTLMRGVIDFLNKLDKEKEGAGDEVGPLEQQVRAAVAERLETVPVTATFTAPKPPPVPRGPEVGNINYQRPKALIRLAQKALGVHTYRDVGEKTFDYFVKAEGIGEEE